MSSSPAGPDYSVPRWAKPCFPCVPSSLRPGPRGEATTAGPRAPAGPRAGRAALRAILRCLDKGWIGRCYLARPASVRPGQRQLQEARRVASLTRQACGGPRYFSPGGPRFPSPRWAHLCTGQLGAGRIIINRCARPRNVASGQAAFIAPAWASFPGDRGCCASPLHAPGLDRRPRRAYPELLRASGAFGQRGQLRYSKIRRFDRGFDTSVI